MTKIDKQRTFSTPRVQGIDEQYKRAKRFVQLATHCKKPASQFRNLIAAVYPARAVVELMLEAAEKQELKLFQNKDTKKSRKEFEEKLIPKLPYYSLLEKIRIHDFHRFGCIPPLQQHKRIFVGGPIKLIANKGSVSLALTPKGPIFAKAGNSSIETQRPLYTENGLFFDEESGKYVPLDKILDDFLSAVRVVITDFTMMVRARGFEPLTKGVQEGLRPSSNISPPLIKGGGHRGRVTT